MSMGTEALYVDSRTGEVVPVDVVEAVARDYRSAEEALRSGRAEVVRLESEVDRIDKDLSAMVPVEGRVDAGPVWIVVEPGDRGSQRVSASGASRFREKLVDLGLGKEVTEKKFEPPTAAQVRANKAAIIAAGIPLAEILPEPEVGKPKLRVVPK
jgi:hypothetical protein